MDDFEDKEGDSESLQSVESKQHQYYPDGYTADPAINEIDQGKLVRLDNNRSDESLPSKQPQTDLGINKGNQQNHGEVNCHLLQCIKGTPIINNRKYIASGWMILRIVLNASLLQMSCSTRAFITIS